MSFSHRNLRKRLRRIALGFAVAAVLTPSAFASLDPSGMPCAPTCPSFESAAGPYGELHQFTGAGIELTVPDGRAIRPTIISGPNAAVVDAVRPVIIGGPSPQHSFDAPRTGPATNLPTFSIDAPRTAPDAIVRPAEQPLWYGSRGRVPLGQPVATTPGTGTELTWPETAAGIGIGVAAALLAAAALGMSRRRDTLQGA